jgi:hypothetical protein
VPNRPLLLSPKKEINTHLEEVGSHHQSTQQCDNGSGLLVCTARLGRLRRCRRISVRLCRIVGCRRIGRQATDLERRGRTITTDGSYVGRERKCGLVIGAAGRLRWTVHGPDDVTALFWGH